MDDRVDRESVATPVRRHFDPDPFHLASPDGTFDAMNGNSAYSLAIFELSQKKFNEQSWSDGYENYNDFYGVSKKAPQLVAMYFPFLHDPPTPDAFSAILELINRAPLHAKNLYWLFQEYPELLPVYAGCALNVVATEAEKKNQQIRNTRISLTTDENVIRKKVEENKSLHNILLEKIDQVVPEEEIPGYPYWTVANPYDVARIVLLKIQIPERDHDKPAVRIRILPENSKQYDFLTYEFDILANGLIDSRRKYKEYQNFGYCFRNEPIDEKEVVEALVSSPFQTSQINAALENIPSLEKYL